MSITKLISIFPIRSAITLILSTEQRITAYLKLQQTKYIRNRIFKKHEDRLVPRQLWHKAVIKTSRVNCRTHHCSRGLSPRRQCSPWISQRNQHPVCPDLFTPCPWIAHPAFAWDEADSRGTLGRLNNLPDSRCSLSLKLWTKGSRESQSHFTIYCSTWTLVALCKPGKVDQNLCFTGGTAGFNTAVTATGFTL